MCLRPIKTDLFVCQVGRAVARDIKLGGASSKFADWSAWLLGVAFYYPTRILLVERLNFLSIEKPFDFYFPFLFT